MLNSKASAPENGAALGGDPHAISVPSRRLSAIESMLFDAHKGDAVPPSVASVTRSGFGAAKVNSPSLELVAMQALAAALNAERDAEELSENAMEDTESSDGEDGGAYSLEALAGAARVVSMSGGAPKAMIAGSIIEEGSCHSDDAERSGLPAGYHQMEELQAEMMRVAPSPSETSTRGEDQAQCAATALISLDENDEQFMDKDAASILVTDVTNIFETSDRVAEQTNDIGRTRSSQNIDERPHNFSQDSSQLAYFHSIEDANSLKASERSTMSIGGEHSSRHHIRGRRPSLQGSYLSITSDANDSLRLVSPCSTQEETNASQAELPSSFEEFLIDKMLREIEKLTLREIIGEVLFGDDANDTDSFPLCVLPADRSPSTAHKAESDSVSDMESNSYTQREHDPPLQPYGACLFDDLDTVTQSLDIYDGEYEDIPSDNRPQSQLRRGLSDRMDLGMDFNKAIPDMDAQIAAETYNREHVRFARVRPGSAAAPKLNGQKFTMSDVEEMFPEMEAARLPFGHKPNDLTYDRFGNRPVSAGFEEMFPEVDTPNVSGGLSRDHYGFFVQKKDRSGNRPVSAGFDEMFPEMDTPNVSGTFSMELYNGLFCAQDDHGLVRPVSAGFDETFPDMDHMHYFESQVDMSALPVTVPVGPLIRQSELTFQSEVTPPLRCVPEPAAPAVLCWKIRPSKDSRLRRDLALAQQLDDRALRALECNMKSGLHSANGRKPMKNGRYSPSRSTRFPVALETVESGSGAGAVGGDESLKTERKISVASVQLPVDDDAPLAAASALATVSVYSLEEESVSAGMLDNIDVGSHAGSTALNGLLYTVGELEVQPLSPTTDRLEHTLNADHTATDPPADNVPLEQNAVSTSCDLTAREPIKVEAAGTNKQYKDKRPVRKVITVISTRKKEIPSRTRRIISSPVQVPMPIVSIPKPPPVVSFSYYSICCDMARVTVENAVTAAIAKGNYVLSYAEKVIPEESIDVCNWQSWKVRSIPIVPTVSRSPVEVRVQSIQNVCRDIINAATLSAANPSLRSAALGYARLARLTSEIALREGTCSILSHHQACNYVPIVINFAIDSILEQVAVKDTASVAMHNILVGTTAALFTRVQVLVDVGFETVMGCIQLGIKCATTVLKTKRDAADTYEKECSLAMEETAVAREVIVDTSLGVVEDDSDDESEIEEVEVERSIWTMETISQSEIASVEDCQYESNVESDSPHKSVVVENNEHDSAYVDSAYVLSSDLKPSLLSCPEAGPYCDENECEPSIGGDSATYESACVRCNQQEASSTAWSQHGDDVYADTMNSATMLPDQEENLLPSTQLTVMDDMCGKPSLVSVTQEFGKSIEPEVNVPLSYGNVPSPKPVSKDAAVGTDDDLFVEVGENDPAVPEVDAAVADSSVAKKDTESLLHATDEDHADQLLESVDFMEELTIDFSDFVGGSQRLRSPMEGSTACFDLTGRSVSSPVPHTKQHTDGGAHFDSCVTTLLSPLMSKLFTESDFLKAIGNDTMIPLAHSPSWHHAPSFKNTLSAEEENCKARRRGNDGTTCILSTVAENKKRVKRTSCSKQAGMKLSSSANNILVGNPCSASNMRKRREANSKRILNGDPNSRIVSDTLVTNDYRVFEALVPKTNSSLMIQFSQSTRERVDRFFISHIDDKSNAAKQGVLMVGDEVLEVNGVKVQGLFTEDLVELILNDGDSFVLLSVRRSRDGTSEDSHSGVIST